MPIDPHDLTPAVDLDALLADLSDSSRLDELLAALADTDPLDELLSALMAVDRMSQSLELLSPYMEGHPTRTVAEALALMAADAENGGAR